MVTTTHSKFQRAEPIPVRLCFERSFHTGQSVIGATCFHARYICVNSFWNWSNQQSVKAIALSLDFVLCWVMWIMALGKGILWRHNSDLRKEQHSSVDRICLQHKSDSGKLDKQSNRDDRYAHEPSLPYPAARWFLNIVSKFLSHQTTWYSLSYKALDLVWSKIWDSGLLAGYCNRNILDIPRAKTGPALGAKTSPESFHRIVHRSSVSLSFLRPACGCFPPCFCRSFCESWCFKFCSIHFNRFCRLAL